MIVTVDYRGYFFKVYGTHTREKPGGWDEAPESEMFEIERILISGVEITELLSDQIEIIEQLCLEKIKL